MIRDTYTPQEVARMTGANVETIRTWRKRGRLRTHHGLKARLTPEEVCEIAALVNVKGGHGKALPYLERQRGEFVKGLRWHWLGQGDNPGGDLMLTLLRSDDSPEPDFRWAAAAALPEFAGYIGGYIHNVRKIAEGL